MKPRQQKKPRCDDFIIYRRKSSDEKSDHQIASLEDQLRELGEVIKRDNIRVVERLQETRTAKMPGRPIFNEMLKDIMDGKASRILCWHLNRLSRNPEDEGKIRWLLQEGIIKEIKTPAKSYFSKDHTLITALEFGQASEYSRELRITAFRNIRGKISRGWRPGVASIGYLNDMSKPQGEREIIPDPERFAIIKKAWQLLLTGAYPVSKIHDLAKNEWGLRTRKTKRQGGKPLSMSHWYQIFTNPFYYGYFYFPEPDENKDDRQRLLFEGKHTPMISFPEFEHAQEILGRKGKPQPKAHEFSYSGLMRCAECGSAIVADQKNQMICSACKFKFDRNAHKVKCPRCGILITEMKNPKLLDYVYYRCSRRKNPNCTQREYLRLNELEAQIDAELEKLDIDTDYLKLALDYLNSKKGEDFKTEETIRKSLQTELDNCDARLKRLNLDYTSSINLDYSLYAPDEYKEQKQAIKGEKQALEARLTAVKQNAENWLELSERTFNFCAYARFHLAHGSLQQKREILSAIGQNLTLKDKNLNIFEYEPFLIIKNTLERIKQQNAALEPEILASKIGKEAAFAASIPAWRGCQDSNLE